MLSTFLVGVVSGCSDPIDPEPVEPTYSWRQETHGLDANLNLSGVWGLSENLFFVIGDNGQWGESSDVIIRCEVGTWTYDLAPRDDPNPARVRDIHMLSSGYGWIVGAPDSYVYKSGEWSKGSSYKFATVWVDIFDYAYAVADSGLFWRRTFLDGWYEAERIDFPSIEFNDMWIILGEHVTLDAEGFAVGNGGSVVRFFGEVSGVEENSGTTQDLYGVWGDSLNAVFVVGDAGTIIQFDGEKWQSMKSGITNNLYSVWGTSSTDVFAVGSKGTILHYDGEGWARMKSNVDSDLKAVWGSSSTNVIAVGRNSTILRFNPDSKD